MKGFVIFLSLLFLIGVVFADPVNDFNTHTDLLGGSAGENLGNFTLGNTSGGQTAVSYGFMQHGGDSTTWGAAAWTKTRFNRTDQVRVNFTVWWPLAYSSAASNTSVMAVLNSANITRDTTNYYYPRGSDYVNFYTLPHPASNTSPIKNNLTFSMAFDGLGNYSSDGGISWTNRSGIPSSYDIEFLGGGYGTTTYVYFWDISVDTYTAPALAPDSSFEIQFIDTSTNIPTSWAWTAANLIGNNTEITFSTDQNPFFFAQSGNWLINLTATNSVGSSTSSQILGFNLSNRKVHFWNRTA